MSFCDMLRVTPSRSANGAKEYFAQSLSKEDYYSEGQEIRGDWQGLGAARLGLSGAVDQEAFDALCENRKPGANERLTQRNKTNRTVGYDFNFHCPKSVSVVYEFTKDERILKAFGASVNATMREIEGEIQTRVRKDGANENRLTGNMIWAEFIHFTARPVKGIPDPHLHAHCYAFNTTWDDLEKKWKAGQFRELKADAPYFEAVFHARFAKELADIGYGIERMAKGWEIAGLPKRVLEEFSKRSEQVEQKAKELGLTSAKEKDGLAAMTRERKQKELSKADLRKIWIQRVTPSERGAIESSKASNRVAFVSESKAMDFAVQHCYERASIATGKELLREALRFGVGSVDVNRTKQELQRDDFVREISSGKQWLTTRQVLAEERRLIEFVQQGRDTCVPFHSGVWRFQNEILSDEQKKAVLHVIQSRGRVTAIRGGAGTGKTTMMKEAVAAIESGGKKVFTFAPSAEASRGVLRSDAGFSEADTIEALLQNSRLQAQIRGQVIWIDEAGLLGAPTLARVVALAESSGCRIILSGDTAQHRSVERGDALRILEKYAGLEAVELTEIRRQKSDEHKAIVADLRCGNLQSAFKGLNRLGMIRSRLLENQHEALAGDYGAALNKGKTALVISPTHAEGERVTREIRRALKNLGRLGNDERTVARFKNVQWTEAQRGDARNYYPGMVIQFHQNAPGFQRGERVTVDEFKNEAVVVARQNGETALLPLDQTSRFQVYELAEIQIAVGDMIRVTQNGFSKDGHRLNNGDLKRVKGFTKEGDIKLESGWIVAKDFAHWTHGYCVTSYASQSKSVDCVFIAENSESFRAADRQQFYVSASRFKEALTIYTDDKRALLEAVSKSSQRPAATDLVSGSVAEHAEKTKEIILSATDGRVPTPIKNVDHKSWSNRVKKGRGISI